MIKLLYTGLKVAIPDVEKHIYTSLLDSYRRNKFLFVTRVDGKNDCVYVSYAPEGAIVEKIGIEFVNPIYDRDLYDVLREKAYKCYTLKTEIRHIKKMIEEKTTK